MPQNKLSFGAGGTPGGIGHFLIGFFMMSAGFYLLLSNIVVTNAWNGFSLGLYQLGTFNVTSGAILIPIIIGIGCVFFNGRSILGWLLCGGGLAALIAGVIMSTHFHFKSISLFDLLVILILAFGGLGLILRSLRPQP